MRQVFSFRIYITTYQLFQFIVFNDSELFLLLLQFSLLFLNCFCCVCLVFSDVDYNTTLQRVCQQVFSFFLQLESSKEIISSLLFPNTKKAGIDSFSSIPALKPRYPLDNTSFFGCQLFRFRNKISFFGSFAFSYPLCFYYLVVC